MATHNTPRGRPFGRRTIIGTIFKVIGGLLLVVSVAAFVGFAFWVLWKLCLLLSGAERLSNLPK